MIELNDALTHAMRVKSFLDPYCTRIEIAGSVRREKPFVKDLEIVVVPCIIQSKDLFDEGEGYSALENAPVNQLGKVVKNGSRYKQIDLGGIMLDLFIVLPPAEFGVQFLIRTGDKFFSHWMVTRRDRTAYSDDSGKFYHGVLPKYAKVKDGAVWEGRDEIFDGTKIFMPEEIDFFKYCGMDYVEPRNRNERFVEKFLNEAK